MSTRDRAGDPRQAAHRPGDRRGAGAARGAAPAVAAGRGPASAPSTPTGDVEPKLEAELAERTADLQRLQAEYVNYKRRVDRDREVVRDTAVANVLGQLLPVLDDIGRAREHDELSGGFKAVAESLERTVSALGLETFGEVGDPFDPRIHEALMHRYSDDVGEPVCEGDPAGRLPDWATGSFGRPASRSPSRRTTVPADRSTAADTAASADVTAADDAKPASTTRFSRRPTTTPRPY